MLTGTAGSLVAVLDACLVNGYNTNNPPGSGWTIAFTATNQRIYRQPVGTNQLYLRVDDTFGNYARVYGCEAATAIGTGSQTGLFPTTTQQSGGLYWVKSNAVDATARSWVVIATGSIFYMYVVTGTTFGTPAQTFHWFGDLVSYKKVTAGVQQVNLTVSNTPNTPSGLVVNTLYMAHVKVDGVIYPISLLGTTGQTLGDVVQSVQTAVGAAATVMLVQGNILIKSNTTGTSSSVVIVAVPVLALQMHFEGPNNATTTVDSANALTVTGAASAKLSTAQFKFGSSSAVFTGAASEYWQVASNAMFDVGSSDFTVELWFRPSSISSGFAQVLLTKAINTGWFPFFIGLRPNGRFYGGISDGSTTYYCADAGPIATINTWYHVALVRYNDVIKTYVNGTSVDGGVSVAGITSFFDTAPLTLGAYSNTSGSSIAANGYLDEVRVYKGQALYTADFAVPTAPFTDPADIIGDPYWLNTELLYHGNDFLDYSKNGRMLSSAYSYAGITISSAQSQFGGTSIRFSTTAAAISLISPNVTLNADFTVELFASLDSLTGGQDFFTFSGIELWVVSGSLLLSGSGSISGAPVTTGVFHHFVWMRYKGVQMLFMDGVFQGSVVSAPTYSGPFYFGSWNGSATNKMVGYLDEIRVTSAARYPLPAIPAAALPENASDPNWSAVTLLLHGEGSIGDASSLAQALTVSGATTTATNAIIGTESISFNGTTSYIDIPAGMDFGTGDFTIEAWIRPTNMGQEFTILDTRVLATLGDGIRFYITSGGQLYADVRAPGAAQTAVFSGGGYVTAGVAVHVAVARQDVVYVLLVNGDPIYSFRASSAVNLSNASGRIGLAINGTGTTAANGLMDEIRITKGVSRYVPSVAIPSAAYPGQATATSINLFALPLTSYSGTGASLPGSSAADPYGTTIMGQVSNSPAVSVSSELQAATGNLMLSNAGFFICRPINGAATSVQGSKFANNMINPGNAGNVSGTKLAMPEPLNQQIYMCPVMVAETSLTVSGTVRGVLPGLWCILNSNPFVMNTRVQGDKITGNGTLAGKTFEMFSTMTTQSFFLETSNTW